ncbi:MAG: hypothetical protein ACREE4_01100 [Stellaceae bacterium]
MSGKWKAFVAIGQSFAAAEYRPGDAQELVGDGGVTTRVGRRASRTSIHTAASGLRRA